MKIDPTVCTYIFWDDKILLGYHKKHNFWIGIGGHIEKDENPDSAAKREAKEEVNLKMISISLQNQVLKRGNIIGQLAIPFYADAHNVGDHNHWCLYYIAKAIDPAKMKVNKKELDDAKWFREDELKNLEMPIHTKDIARLAFKEYKRFR